MYTGNESTTTDYYLLFTSTYTVLLIDSATNIHSKETQKKTPSQTRESDGARGPLSRGAFVTERAPRDRCRLPASSRCLDGRVATSVPTAAGIAAAELGPDTGPASSLRRFSHGRAGSCDTAGRAAPPVRVPGATPGLSDCELQRTGRSTDRFSTDQGHQEEEEEEAEDHQKTTSRLT